MKEAVVLARGAKEGLLEAGTSEQTWEEGEGVSRGDIQRMHLPGRGNSKCKCPEVVRCCRKSCGWEQGHCRVL